MPEIWSHGWHGSVSTEMGQLKTSPRGTRVQGTKGQGRAGQCRSYTVFVTHLPTGKKMEETIGPAYWSKKRWQREREQAFARLKKALTP